MSVTNAKKIKSPNADPKADKIKDPKNISNTESELHTKIEKLNRNFTDAISLEKNFINNRNHINQVYSPNRGLDSIILKSIEFITKLEDLVHKLELEKTEFVNFQKKFDDTNINVAMFGDVSAGKSQTINCILRRRLFIPAYCLSTICFVNIHFDTNVEYATIKVPRQDSVTEHSNIDQLREAVKELSNFNGKDKLRPDDILEITLKTDKYNVIMRENVVLMDCPGANDSQEVTDNIEAVLVKADIFLYVLTQVIFEQQRQFFKRLLSKTSAPNIFVIVNKWDETDNDDAADTIKARESLTKEISTWMNEMELNEDNHDLCKDRIFFISAKETLKCKTDDSFIKGLSNEQRQRYDEFERFVKIFGEHLDDPRNIKVVKHSNELVKMKRNLDDLGCRIMKEWLPLRQMKMNCVERIDAKIDRLKNTQQMLIQEATDSLQKKVYLNSDKWYSKRLDIIRKRLEEFYDERPVQPDESKSWLNYLKKPFKYLSNKEIVKESKKEKKEIWKLGGNSRNEQTKVEALERDANDTNVKGRGTDNEGGLNEEEKAELETKKQTLVSRFCAYLEREIDIIKTALETEQQYFLTNITEVNEQLPCDDPIGQH